MHPRLAEKKEMPCPLFAFRMEKETDSLEGKDRAAGRICAHRGKESCISMRGKLREEASFHCLYLLSRGKGEGWEVQLLCDMPEEKDNS